MEDINFRFHYPRGTLSKKMSGLELATFILPHIPNIIPLLKSNPQIQLTMQNLLLELTTTPKSSLDEILSWIKGIVHESDFDVIEMNPIRQI